MKLAPALSFVLSIVSSISATEFCDSGKVGTGLCKDTSLCCSKWGWCGSTSTHCDPSTCISGPTCPNGNTMSPTEAPTNSPVAMNVTAAPTAEPTTVPTYNPSSKPSAIPTQEPIASTTPSPTVSPTVKVTTSQPGTTPCGNGVVGNGLCEDSCACCSGWGWCSVLEAHCATDTCFSSPDNSCTRPEAVFRAPSECDVGSTPNPAPTRAPTSAPTFEAPTKSPTSAETATPAPVTPAPTFSSTSQATGLPTSPAPPTSGVAAVVEAVLESSKSGIDNNLFLYETSTGQWEPSSVYRYNGLLAGIRVMYQSGVNGNFFYMGDNSENGHEYGLVNIASFLAQSMKETIKYDACDENSWDLVNGVYPLSNACGQLGQSYQDYHCSAEEAHMECPVDTNMSITATTNAKWYGAPGPLKCGPKTEIPVAGFWDYSAECNKPWDSPPSYCTAYEGQQAGAENNQSPVSNNSGRDDVEGCCWWGRGVIQTTGVCNFGKLNYFLGKRAADEGRESQYPTIDFCQDPGAICASQEFTELKWIAGMFYWMESVQRYDVGGWNYMAELHKFVDGGMSDNGFVDAVSGIVNRGCHNPPCASGHVDGGADRRDNFRKVLTEFGLNTRRSRGLRTHSQ